jgi:hypothetical protein
MKKSELRQIIQEEIKAALEAEDPIQTSFRDALKKKGAEFSSGGGNKLKEKEFTFSYMYRGGRDGDDEFDDEITVSAPDKETARDKAWEKVKHKPVIGQKKGLR